MALAFATSAVWAAPDAMQLPTGGQVTAGQAVISQSGARMTIQQDSQRAAVDWQTFNVGNAAQVNFVQPSASAVTLNRVLDANPSQIFGRINANGQVFISNPNGIVFGAGASLNVGGLVATTHHISLDDFMAGKFHFSREGATGSVINAGELNTSLGGYIALLAPEVRNQGVIIANMGTVALAAGETFELQFDSKNTLANLRVAPSTVNALVENGNAVLAPGGLIILSAQAVDRIQSGIIQHTGLLEASSLVERGGKIILEADHITLSSGSRIKATGAAGGGEVLVGGAWQGGGDLHQATTVTMETGATIDVSATKVGAGGKAVLWSDVSKAESLTAVHGTILAKGGLEGGDGGKVETSGHHVNFEHATVLAGATQGQTGLWLVDPVGDYTINSGNVGAIQTSLNGGTDYTLYVDNGHLTIDTDISKNGGSDATLTLKSDGNILLNANRSIRSTSNRLNVVLWSDYDNSIGGGVTTFGNSNITTNGGGLWIGGSDSTGGTSIWEPYQGASAIAVGNGYAKSVGAGNYNYGINLVGGTLNAGSGDILLRGQSINAGAYSFGIGINAYAYDSNLTIAGRNISFDGKGSTANTGDSNWGSWIGAANGRTATVTATGTLAITGTGGGSGASTGNFGVSLGNGLGMASISAGSIALTGAGAKNDIEISTTLTAAGPIAISGGNLTLLSTGGLTTTNTNGDVLLKATGNIVQASSVSVTTSGGDVTYWADSDNSGQGYIALNAGDSISTGGGNILLAGGLDDGGVNAGLSGLTAGDGSPDGYAKTTGTAALNAVDGGGVSVGLAGNTGSSVNLLSSGGDITIRGQGTASTGSGIASQDIFKIDSGTGHVDMQGKSLAHGLNFGWLGIPNWAITSANTSADAITLSGQTSGSSTAGLIMGNVSSGNSLIQASGAGGGVNLSGTNSAGGAGGWGLFMTLAGSTVQILAQSGPINLTGYRATATGTDFISGSSLYIGNRKDSTAINGVTPLVTGSSANITFNVDGFSFVNGTTYLSSTGTLTVQPYSASFDAAQTWGITPASTFTGLQLGKPGNTSNITISAAQTIAGPISIYGGNINLNTSLNTTAGGANGDVLLKATGNIVQASSVSVTTSGGDVTYWADSDNSGQGYIALNAGDSISTGGGNILLAGGLDDGGVNAGLSGLTAGDGSPDGYAKTTGTAALNAVDGGGVSVGLAGNTGSSVNLLSSGGDITIRGQGTASTGSGIASQDIFKIDSGTGRVDMQGKSLAHGLNFGWLGTPNWAITSANTTANAITLSGQTSGSIHAGLILGNVSSGNSLIQATGAGGGVNLSGTNSAGGTGGNGLYASNAGSTVQILAQSGPINLTGYRATATGNDFNSGSSLYIGNRKDSTAINGVTPLVTGSSANITFNVDGFSFVDNTTYLSSTGTLTVQPYSASFDAAQTWGITPASTFTGLQLGKPGNTSGVTVSAAQTINGPINVFGGQIAVNGALSAAGDINLMGQTAGQLGITGAGVSIAADVTTTAGSNGNITITGRGGNAAGGSQYGVSVADGKTVKPGGTGNVNVTGMGGASAGDNNYGVYVLGNSVAPEGIISTSGGNLSIIGIGGGTGSSASNHGVRVSGAVSSSGSGTVTIHGTGGSATGTGQYGVRLTTNNIALPTTVTSAGGAITLTGIGGANGSADNDGVSLFGTVGSVNSGAITVTGTRGNGNGSGATSSDGIYVNGIAGVSTVGFTGYSGNVELVTDVLNFSAAGRVTSSGALAIKPLTADTSIGVAGGAGTLQVPATAFSSYLTDGFANITIGRSDGTGAISVGALTTTDNLTLLSHTGAVGISGLVNAGTNTVTVQTSGTATQSGSGAIAASNLLLQDESSVAMAGANAVATLAASNVGNFSFTNTGALTVGTVGATNGIGSTGTVAINTTNGNLTVAQNITTSNTTATAVVLNAGVSTAAGTSTGGNIVFSGSPTISVGSGGKATLMTGSVAGSTGLTALVGSGSGRFRYNSDETTTHFSTALGAGLNAIYRELITISGLADNQTMTYGDSLPTFTGGPITGLVNGDTASYTVMGRQDSTAGNIKADSYAIGADAINGLGYSGNFGSATLTVSTKTLNLVGFNADDRTYDGNTTATINQVGSLSGLISNDNVSFNHTGANFDSKDAGLIKIVTLNGISLNGTDAYNYSIASSVTDTASITPKTITLSATRSYDGTNDLTGAVSIAGMVGSETLNYSNASAFDRHVATANNYINAITLNDGDYGGLARNYALPTLNATNAALTLTAAILSPSLSNTAVTKSYDGTTNAPTGFIPTWSLSGLVVGDSAATLNYSNATYNNANVAQANAVTVSGLTLDSFTGSNGSLASDYALDAGSKSIAATITRANLTVKADNDAILTT